MKIIQEENQVTFESHSFLKLLHSCFLAVCPASQIGNGVCDRHCNQEIHNMDGFDCCLEHIKITDDCQCMKDVVVSQFQCFQCKCLTDDLYHALECPVSRQGDGQCQDYCNTVDFDYDDGDCCMDYIYDLRCSDCICHEDQSRHFPSNH